MSRSDLLQLFLWGFVKSEVEFCHAHNPKTTGGVKYEQQLKKLTAFIAKFLAQS
jgi:hypothetical protein